MSASAKELPFWQNSSHASAEISCEDCHEQGVTIEPDSINALCYTCHEDRKDTFLATVHGENGLTCVDCHDPHGTAFNKLLKDNQRALCQQCHEWEPHHFIADKVTTKQKKLDCLACHNTHYGKGENWLKYKKENLCVQCHKSFY